MFRYKGAGWRVAKSIETFGNQIMILRGTTQTYPKDGTLGDAAHSNRLSDHNPDVDGIVRAIDVDENFNGFIDLVATRLRRGRDARLKYFIHDNRMFSSYSTAARAAWEWGEYTGPNGHNDHGHLSVVATTAADSSKPWDIMNPVSPPTPDPGDEDLTPSQFASRLSPQQVDVVCNTRGEGGKWIVFPGNNDRASLTAQMTALLSDPDHPSWHQFFEETTTEAYVNAAVRKAGQ